jgi:hypothetical protein
MIIRPPSVTDRPSWERLWEAYLHFYGHDDGWRSMYMHLNNDTPGTDDGRAIGFAEGIKEGMHVTAGTVIGFVGDSGNAESTAPHLHFELHQPDGLKINSFRATAPTCSANCDGHSKGLGRGNSRRGDEVGRFGEELTCDSQGEGRPDARLDLLLTSLDAGSRVKPLGQVPVRNRLGTQSTARPTLGTSVPRCICQIPKAAATAKASVAKPQLPFVLHGSGLAAHSESSPSVAPFGLWPLFNYGPPSDGQGMDMKDR